MPPHPLTPEQERLRHREALLKSLDWAANFAYLQAARCGIGMLVLAITGPDWGAMGRLLVFGVLYASLGYGVGERHSDKAAIELLFVAFTDWIVYVVIQLNHGVIPFFHLSLLSAWFYWKAILAVDELKEIESATASGEPQGGSATSVTP
jgi:hypothetical protein